MGLGERCELEARIPRYYYKIGFLLISKKGCLPSVKLRADGGGVVVVLLGLFRSDQVVECSKRQPVVWQNDPEFDTSFQNDSDALISSLS